MNPGAPLQTRASPEPAAQEPARPGGLQRLALGAALVVASVASLLTLAAPSPAPSDAPVAEFSAARALPHVEALAAAPRAPGTRHHAEARAYILDALGAVGVRAEVQSAVGARALRTDLVLTARVHNIVARIPGRGGGAGAVLLMAHYDSVPTGPGAGDNAAGVAALLEVARALSARPALAHDLLLLFTDAEEYGLLGARVFLAEHPDAARVRVVINVEGRGAAGAALLFETSEDNAWLLDAFAQAPDPAGNTLCHEVYKRLPHDTDLTPFLRSGVPAMNFGFIQRAMVYHTRLDDPAHLDPGSLQHHGDTLLALAGGLGEADLERPAPPAGNDTFFNLPFVLVRYPTGAAAPLSIFAAVLVVAALVVAARRRQLRLGRALAAALLQAFAAALVGGVGYGLTSALFGGFAALRAHPLGQPWEGDLLIVAVGAVATALYTALMARAATRFAVSELAMGALLAWSALNLTITLLAPDAAWLLTWPTLLTAAVLLTDRSRADAPQGWAATARLAATGLPLALLVVPTLVWTHHATLLRGAPVTLLVLAALLSLGLPHLQHLAPRRAWIAPAAAAGIAVVAASVALLRLGPTQERPQPSELNLLVRPAGAAWITTPDLPAATRQRLPPGGAPAGPLAALHPTLRGALVAIPAQLATSPPTPTLTFGAGSTPTRLDAAVGWRDEAAELTLRLPRPSTLTLDGEPIPLPAGTGPLTVIARGFDHPLRLGATWPAPPGGEAQITDRTFSVPLDLPDDTMPTPWGFGIGHATLTTSTTPLPGGAAPARNAEQK